MARVFITGSSDGLGQEAARCLVGLGHDVVLYGRNRDRAQEAMRAVPAAGMALEGDPASVEQTRELAAQANAAGDGLTFGDGRGLRRKKNAGNVLPGCA